MKALTLWQPWADAIARGFKNYETRHWSTNHRGPIAIHAAKRSDPILEAHMLEGFGNYCDTHLDEGARETLAGLGQPADWARGAIVATATLVQCHTIGPNFLSGLDRFEYLFGNYEPGRFAWDLQDIKRLPEPIPVKGMQGLWEWESR